MNAAVAAAHPAVSEDEISFALLGELGFRAAGEYIGYAADFSDL
jgi:hypothetical protein